MTESTPHPGQLIAAANGNGEISADTAAALYSGVVPLRIKQILASSYSVGATSAGKQILLVTVVPDDSPSIFDAYGAVESEMDGHNNLIDFLRESEVASRTLLQTIYLHGAVLNPFMPLPACQKMTRSNFPEHDGTPLFDSTLNVLGSVIAKAEELRAKGAIVKTATLLISDGEATDHTLAGEKLLKGFMTDLGMTNRHYVAAMRIGEKAPAIKTFSQMGIKHVFSATDAASVAEAFRGFAREALALTSGR